MIIQPVEGVGSGRDQDRESLSLPVMMMMSRRKISLIDMIPHVDNGGCTKEEHTLGLGWAVGTDVGVRKGWQRRGRQCLHSIHLGLIHCVLGRIVYPQICVVVAALVGCQWPDLCPALPPTPFLLVVYPAALLHIPQPCPSFCPSLPSCLDHPQPSHCRSHCSSRCYHHGHWYCISGALPLQDGA